MIDQEYGGDRMLLAEANQWPEDVRPYFGNGDEFHMAFHFPLMPRLYWGSGARTACRSPTSSRTRRRSLRPASGACSCGITTS